MESPKKKFPLLDPVNFIASLLGSGFLPKMPGTWGSIFSFAIYLLLPAAWFEGIARFCFLAAFAIFCLFSVWISSLAEKRLGHDAPQIVIDEFCGFFLSVLFLPYSVMVGLWALILFRAFDISKFWIVGKAQNLPKGWGVVVDDLAAGLFANLILQVLTRVRPQFFTII